MSISRTDSILTKKNIFKAFTSIVVGGYCVSNPLAFFGLMGVAAGHNIFYYKPFGIPKKIDYLCEKYNIPRIGLLLHNATKTVEKTEKTIGPVGKSLVGFCLSASSFYYTKGYGHSFFDSTYPGTFGGFCASVGMVFSAYGATELILNSCFPQFST